MAAQALAGFMVRRAREEAGLSQVALARRAVISPSYLNQIEHNVRALTPSLQIRFAQILGVDAQALSVVPEARAAAALVDAFASQPDLGPLAMADIHTMSSQLPDVAELLVELTTERRKDKERIEALESRLGDDRGGAVAPPMPYEAVRDFFSAHHNYFDSLDRLAEQLAADLALRPRSRYEQVRKHLEDLGVQVIERPRSVVGGHRRYDPQTRSLQIAEELRDPQRTFQAASQIAFLSGLDAIEAIASTVPVPDPVTRRLTRIGLANYFAGALILPYREFLAAARRVRYDVDVLSAEFDVGFETTCHRLNTLQRPDDRGVPFALVRVDRAGNVSKRQSATPFHFSSIGGTCPLWVLYDAFSQPGQVLTQVAEMPDGRAYLWVARTVASGSAGFRAPGKTFAIGLGCDLEYADKLVYSAGRDLADPAARTQIGVGCKVCDRPACPQRAFPFVGRTLQVDEHRSQLYPYMHEADPAD